MTSNHLHERSTHWFWAAWSMSQTPGCDLLGGLTTLILTPGGANAGGLIKNSGVSDLSCGPPITSPESPRLHIMGGGGGRITGIGSDNKLGRRSDDVASANCSQSLFGVSSSPSSSSCSSCSSWSNMVGEASSSSMEVKFWRAIRMVLGRILSMEETWASIQQSREFEVS